MLAVVVGLVAAGTSAAAPSASTSSDWTAVAMGPTGGVRAIAQSGDIAYLAGTFAGVARRTGPFAGFEASEPGGGPGEWERGDLVAETSEIDGAAASDPVVAAAPDGDGGWYVAGRFTGASGVEQPTLLRFTAAGAIDPAFDPEITTTTVFSGDLEVGPDGTLYVGGNFTQIDGQDRDGLAALDGETGEVEPWRPDLDHSSGSAPTVTELELGPGGLYIAGSFTHVGGQLRGGLAQVSIGDGTPTPWAPPGQASGIQALEQAGSSVFLGGTFTQMGGQPRSLLAAVNATSGALQDWNPNVGGFSVQTIAVQESTVYVGGNFTRIGAPPPGPSPPPQPTRNRVAALDADSAIATSFNPNANDDVTAILAAGDQVYLAGQFTNVGGDVRCGLAAVHADDGDENPDPTPDGDATPWHPHLSIAAASNTCPTNTFDIRVLERFGGHIWVGGELEAANTEARGGLAAIDVADDVLLDWAPTTGTSGTSNVNDIAVSPDGTRVYLAGTFAAVNLVPRARAAAVAASVDPTDTAADQTAVLEWNPSPAGGGLAVNTLALSPNGSTVYLGGSFATVGGQDLPELAAVSATDAGTPTAWRPDPDGAVNDDLSVANDGTVFAAGSFTHIGWTETGSGTDQPARTGVAAIDPLSGEATSWDAQLPATGVDVFDVALGDAVVYIAGAFDTTVQGQARRRVLAVRRDGGALTDWAPQPAGGTGTPTVRTVTVAPDGTVYLVGSFNDVGGQSRLGAASVTPGGTVPGWRPEGLSQSNTLRPEVAFSGERVVVGGSFRTVNGRPQAGFAIFDKAVEPGFVAAPAVDGPLQVGGRLVCLEGEWSGSRPFVESYRWLRNGAPIPGATSASYTTGGNDAFQELSCEEKVANAAGELSHASEPVTVVGQPPVNDLPPEVVGPPRVGGEAACSTGLWRNQPEDFDYRWMLDGAAISGATGPAYRPADSDLDRRLACEVVAMNQAGAGPPAVSQAVRVLGPPPRNTSPPRIQGDPLIGAALGCDPGTWERPGTLTYAWLRDGQPIRRATSPGYTVAAEDAGRLLVCRVTANDGGGPVMADSEPVIIAPQQDELLQPLLLPLPLGSLVRPRDNGFRITRARGSARGIRLTLRLPGAGTVRIAGSAKPRRGRAIRLPAARPVAVARAGTRRFTLRLSSRARRMLSRSRRLRVTLNVTFTPRNGSPRTLSRTVTVRAG